MATSPQVALAVESCILAAHLVMTFFAAIVYFGRKSYKCILLPFSKHLMSRSQASRRLALKVNQRWSLDLLVSSLLVVNILRTLSEILRVYTCIRQLEFGVKGTPTLDKIWAPAVLISVTSYSLVFCALIWMWLKMLIVLFDENDSKRSCMLWTVRVTTTCCIVSAAITATGLSVIFCMPETFLKAPIPALIVIALCVLLYFVSLAALCTVVLILGIRIIVLIRKTTAASSDLREKDTLAVSTRRKALVKISVAVIAFVLALIIRVLGIGMLVLGMYIPSWITLLMLFSMPEFVTFGTLIVILWPFNVKCCNKFDTLEDEEESKVEVEMKKEALPKPVLESVTTGIETSPASVNQQPMTCFQLPDK